MLNVLLIDDDRVMLHEARRVRPSQEPLALRRLQQIVSEAAEVARLRAPVALATEPVAAGPDGALCGTSPGMLEVYKAIGRVAAQDVTVLITGESVTGKELVARDGNHRTSRALWSLMMTREASTPPRPARDRTLSTVTNS